MGLSCLNGSLTCLAGEYGTKAKIVAGVKRKASKATRLRERVVMVRCVLWICNTLLVLPVVPTIFLNLVPVCFRSRMLVYVILYIGTHKSMSTVSPFDVAFAKVGEFVEIRGELAGNRLYVVVSTSFTYGFSIVPLALGNLGFGMKIV